MMSILGSLLPGLAIAVVSAVVSAKSTVHFAFKKFRAERWWDRKADAYAAIIEALHYAKQGTEFNLWYMKQKRRDDINREAAAQITKESKDAWGNIGKAVNTGSFLLCREARKTLGSMIGALETVHGPALAILENQLEAVNQCLEILPAIARKDLSIEE